MKYLSKIEFKRLNNRAISKGYNRSVYRRAYDIINEDDLLPIVFSFDHSYTDCIRCQIAITDTVKVWLDIAYKDYDKLNSYYYEDTHAEIKPFNPTIPNHGLRLTNDTQDQAT